MSSYIWWDEDYVNFVLDQHTWFNFYSTRLLKQQYAGRHVTPLGHIILRDNNILLLLVKAACLPTLLGLEPPIYHTQHKHVNNYIW